MAHRLHVVSLPHTQTTRAFSTCAYTEKVRKFCDMMTARGHEVILYAGEQNEAACAEHIVCLSEHDRLEVVGDVHYTEANFDPNEWHWVKFNNAVIKQMHRRIKPTDFICLIGGWAQKAIAEKYPANITVEFGVGYGGIFSKFRVWESYAWMHTVYGARSNNNPHAIDGDAYDAVIPGYLEEEAFPFVPGIERENYLLFVGRMVQRKGIEVAVEVAKRAKRKLIMAGPGIPPDDPIVEYVGEVGPEQRAKLMGHAAALIAPTLYIEPFGNVVPEAMMCGTPVLTHDWGAFTETNIQGVTGYRCRMVREFVEAVGLCDKLDYQRIRNLAQKRFTMAVVAQQYEEYFTRLTTLWGRGYYED